MNGERIEVNYSEDCIVCKLNIAKPRFPLISFDYSFFNHVWINVNDLRMFCIRGQERINLVSLLYFTYSKAVQRRNAEIAKLTSSIVDRYQKGEVELAKIQVRVMVSSHS